MLTLLFVKYVSDKYAADPNALIEVPPDARFADMVAAKGDKEIGDRINKARRDKTRQLEQGMMQVLLTGRIRLM